MDAELKSVSMSEARDALDRLATAAQGKWMSEQDWEDVATVRAALAAVEQLVEAAGAISMWEAWQITPPIPTQLINALDTALARFQAGSPADTKEGA